MRARHGAHDLARAHRAGFDLFGGGEAHRDQVVLAVDLRAVAGEIEQADAASRLELRAELMDRVLHRGLIGVGRHRHVEASLLERLGHRLGVVLGVPEWAEGVVGIADDERRAGGGRLRLGQRQRGEKRERP